MKTALSQLTRERVIADNSQVLAFFPVLRFNLMSASKVDELQSEVTLGNKNVRRLLSKEETTKSHIV